jgi:RND family efflux transporter MFP subunit
VARLASAEANRVVRQAGVQSAQSTVARAKQEIAAANHSVKEAEANVAAHAVRLSFASVTAPFKGTVVQRLVDTGAYIAGGDGSSQPTALFRLIRSGGVRVVFPIPEREVPFIKKGANVVISGAGVSGAPIASKITLVPSALTDSNRTLAVQALSNDSRLVPGMGIRGQIHMETHSGVVTVPSAALHFNKKKAHVLCIRDGAVVKVGVVVGFNDLIRAEVKGVEETDDVIFESRSKVKVGDRVHSSEGDGR